jgi:hypothetical protein
MSRLDQYDISVFLDGAPLGTFDKMSGGNIDSEEVKYKPGGMAPQISLGGSVTVNNVTVERLFRLDRDPALIPTLKTRVGKGAVTISRQALDIDGNPFGSPIVWSGKLKQLTFPEPDSESNAAGIFQLEVSSNGTVSA